MSCEKRYRALESNRNYYLKRAWTASQLTLPYLIPLSDEPYPNDTQTFPLPWNGIGARGVYNLASRLLLALLPPTETFFRFTFDEIELVKHQQQLQAAGATPEEMGRSKSQLDLELARLERAVLRSIETSNDRVAVHEMLLHLIVGGNALMCVAEEGLKCFHLNRYVCCRDLMGNPLEAIVCEQLSVESLPANARQILEEEDGEVRGIVDDEMTPEHERVIRLYTHIEWEGKKVRWYSGDQGSGDPRLPWDRQHQRFPLAAAAHVQARWAGLLTGGYVEAACIADLQTAEALSQAIAEGSLVSAQVKHLVKPSGVTNPKKLAEAPNGACVPGEPD